MHCSGLRSSAVDRLSTSRGLPLSAIRAQLTNTHADVQELAAPASQSVQRQAAAESAANAAQQACLAVPRRTVAPPKQAPQPPHYLQVRGSA